jgi:signal transduction histidine kinase
VSLFRSVGARLSLALLIVVAAALGLVYVIVVPSLQHRLVDSKVSQLERAAPNLAREFGRTPIKQDAVDTAAIETGARVVALQLLNSPPTPLLGVVNDSRQGAPPADSAALALDPVALRAVATAARAHGTVNRLGDRYAEVAVPLRRSAAVLLFSAPLHGTLEDVDLVERRLVLAGLLALLVALTIGYAAARVFARRIRRLERAADRIASGRFDEPVADASSDELGQLSRAFDRMRVQLAGLDRARREFVANASHELRTPLFSLGGFLELLQDEELDEPTRREFLETMADQVRRLTKLTEELLDLSRLDAGRLHVEIAPLDLASVAAVAVDEFAGAARATDHPLELLADGAAPARGDEQRALQIIRTLIENALVHTPPGTAVRVSSGRGNGRAVVTVEDEGPGIAADDQLQLFERFYRGGSTKASGSGLGLAIARELAKRMEGTIELSAQPGATRFTLALPAEPASDSG